MKIGCVIQGDIRRGTAEALKFLLKKVDYVVLSTWKSDEDKLPAGDYARILNQFPAKKGVTNRNYQRYTAARGMEMARQEGCDFVLKWRTDMIPLGLDVDRLVEMVNENAPSNAKSRILMPAFRNLTISQDWFSTIPDLFSFGHIDEMDKLWSDHDFDYEKEMNFPQRMLDEMGAELKIQRKIEEIYCAEAELYAIYKSRILKEFPQINVTHRDLLKGRMRLFDHRRLNIVWFDNFGSYRSITQAWEHPWWTEKIWAHGEPKILDAGYQADGLIACLKKKLSPSIVAINKLEQRIRWNIEKWAIN